MVLVLEAYTHLWSEVARLYPGDRPGSMSDTSTGTRKVYLFECMDNSTSRIYVSNTDGEEEMGDLRILARGGLTLFQELKSASLCEIVIKTDKSPEPRKIRFRQI